MKKSQNWTYPFAAAVILGAVVGLVSMPSGLRVALSAGALLLALVALTMVIRGYRARRSSPS